MRDFEQWARLRRESRDFLLWRVTTRATRGAVGASADLEFEDPSGRAVAVSLRRWERGGTPFRMQGLPPFHLESRQQVLGDGSLRVGVLWFNNWFAPLQRTLDDTLLEWNQLDGIVLDLRGNTGGDGSMVGTVGGHFFASGTTLGVQRMRHGSMRYVADPDRRTRRARDGPTYAGPVAILIDGTTGSTSEVFSGCMQSVRRARVFGQTSGGAVLPARTKLLPNGDSLLYAIGDFRTARGTLLEGRGVVPDEPVALRADDLRAGRDRVLERALRWVETQARQPILQAFSPR